MFQIFRLVSSINWQLFPRNQKPKQALRACSKIICPPDDIPLCDKNNVLIFLLRTWPQSCSYEKTNPRLVFPPCFFLHLVFGDVFFTRRNNRSMSRLHWTERGRLPRTRHHGQHFHMSRKFNHPFGFRWSFWHVCLVYGQYWPYYFGDCTGQLCGDCFQCGWMY